MRQTIWIGALIVCTTAGCSQARRDNNADQRIREMASTWAPYRAPYVPDRMIEAGQNVADQVRSINRPGANSPQVDPIKVVKPYYDWDMEETAIDALGRIGTAAVPHLRTLLRSNEPEERQSAAKMLARIGPAAKNAVPDLIAALDDPYPPVRKTAARALGQIGEDAADAVDALFRVIQQEQAASQPPANAPGP